MGIPPRFSQRKIEKSYAGIDAKTKSNMKKDITTKANINQEITSWTSIDWLVND